MPCRYIYANNYTVWQDLAPICTWSGNENSELHQRHNMTTDYEVSCNQLTD